MLKSKLWRCAFMKTMIGHIGQWIHNIHSSFNCYTPGVHIETTHAYRVVSECYASWCKTCTSFANYTAWKWDKENRGHIGGSRGWNSASERISHKFGRQVVVLFLQSPLSSCVVSEACITHTYLCTYRHTIGREEVVYTYIYVHTYFLSYPLLWNTERDTVYYIEPFHNMHKNYTTDYILMFKGTYFTGTNYFYQIFALTLFVELGTHWYLKFLICSS